jgi:hypothetical protein
MWKIWLAAGVVGVATFAVVAVLGLRAVDDDAAAEPPAPTRKTAVVARTWAERANQLCLASIRDVRAVLVRPPAAGETTQDIQLRFFLETTEIEGQLVEGLRALPATRDRAKIDEALDRLKQEFDRDTLTANALRRKFDLAALRSRITQYERAAARLRTLFGSLGADSCVAYFDPASFG